MNIVHQPSRLPHEVTKFLKGTAMAGHLGGRNWPATAMRAQL
jgi:hypothetical protein